jgi:hypothetical protein
MCSATPANRQLLTAGLAAAGITQVAAADGAFYVYADVTELATEAGDSMALCYAVARRAGRCGDARSRLRSGPRPSLRSLQLRGCGRRHRRGLRPSCAVGAMSAPSGHAGPLADLRVIDLSTVLAGPNCARYLADFGADVIKVERPVGGDSLRNMAWRDPRDGEGLWWKLVNRNKRTVALDLKNTADLALLRSLVAEADVLVENFRPGTLERLGLGPDELLALQPDAGDHSRDRLRPDRPVRGPSRLRHDRGGDERPLRDQRPARTAAVAAADRTHRRGDRPRGGVRDDGGAAQRRRPGGGCLVAGEPVPADGPAHQPLPPHRAGAAAPRRRAALQRAAGYLPLCSDGKWVGLSTSSDSVAARVLRVLGVEDDARFTTFAARMQHRDGAGGRDERVVRCAIRRQTCCARSPMRRPRSAR